MALSNQDRVLEKSETTGTGTYRLQGSPGITGFGINDYNTFASVGNGNTCIYTAVGVDPATGKPNNTGWEEGLGTYTSSSRTLARTTIYRSTNANAAVNWGDGTRFISCSPQTQGTVVVRQPGGTPGSDEGQFSHDGTRLQIRCMDGITRVLAYAAAGNQDPVFEIYSRLGDRGMLQVTDNGYTSIGSIRLGSDVGGGFVAKMGSTDETEWRFSSDSYFVWTESTTFAASTDTAFSRAAAAVIRATKPDGTLPGWFQNSAGVAILDANFTSTSTTMANTNLSRTVISGRKYAFKLFLPINNVTAGDGFKCDFSGSTATATTFYAVSQAFGVVTPGVDVSSALATDLTVPSVTSTGFVIITGAFVVSSGGTFCLRAAKNSDAAGATMTLLAGAYMKLDDLVGV